MAWSLCRCIPITTPQESQLTISRGLESKPDLVYDSPKADGVGVPLLERTIESGCRFGSGAEDNFIDSEVVKQMGILTELLEGPLEAQSVNGPKLFKVLHKTVPVPMILPKS